LTLSWIIAGMSPAASDRVVRTVDMLSTIV
jgi:hypothetical protein